MKLRKRIIASLLAMTLVVPLFSAAATPGTVQAATAQSQITQAQGKQNDLCEETAEEYAVLSGNVKLNYTNEETFNNWANVEFNVTDLSSIQVLWLMNEKQWEIKVPIEYNRTRNDGVTVDMDQKGGATLLANIKESVGLDFKVVRLGDWAYFLVKDTTDGKYELVGKMNGLSGQNTYFKMKNDCLQSGDTVDLSYAVTTGKEEALAALEGSKFSVEYTSGEGAGDVADSVYLPVESTEWTVQARVSLPDYNTYISEGTEHRLMHVGPGAGGFTQYAWNYGMSFDHWGNWVVQSPGIWTQNTIDTAHAAMMSPTAGGMWVRWVRSGSALSVYTSADGNTWAYVHGRTDLGEMDRRATGIYIDAEKKTDFTDFKITLKANITQAQEMQNVLCGETAEEYAVLSGKVKLNYTENTFNNWANVEFNVTPSSSIQVLWRIDLSKWEIKVPWDHNRTRNDGVTVDMDQTGGATLLANIKESVGLDFKVVRLGDWAYFLVKDTTDGKYELVGKMNGLNGQNTNFMMKNGCLQANDTVELSNYTVTTGKEEALAALEGSKFSVEYTSGYGLSDVADSVYFPVKSTEWTVQARVSLPDYDRLNSATNRSMHVGPGAGGFTQYAWNYGMSIHHEGAWWVQCPKSVGDWTSLYINEEHAAMLDPNKGGMWVRWVRRGSELSVYTSADGNTWTHLGDRTDLGEMDPSATGIYIDAENKTDLTDFKITLAKAKVVGAQASIGDKITMNFFMNFTDEILADPDAKVEYTLPDEKSTKGSVLVKDLTESTYEGAPYKVFSCDVAAKEMASDIKFKVVAGDGTYGEEFKYNVQTYAEYIINTVDSAYTTEDKTMATAMLNYGGYAQQYFGFNAENLANANIDSTLANVNPADIPSATWSTPAGLNYYGTSLMTTSATAIRHYFTLEAGKTIDEYTFKCGDNTLTPVANGAYYYVEISGITAAQLGDSFTLTINGENTLTYSPYTYVKAVLEGTYDVKLQNLAKAIYHYGQAAVALKKN